MFRSNSEPTIDEIMRDPTVRALMKADRVDMAKFEAKLRGLARAIRREPADAAKPTVAPSGRRMPLGAMPERAAVSARHCWC